MRPISRRALCALTALLLLTFSGCEYKQVTVRLSDLEASEVEGVRFWRLSDRTGSFEPGGALHFTGIGVKKGVEYIFYSTVHANGAQGLALQVPVARDPANPERATMRLWYPRVEDQGWFKVTSFNSAGESPLSDEQVFL